MSDDEEAVDVEETVGRLIAEVDQLREHLIYISQAVRSTVSALSREEGDDDQSVH